MERKSWKSFLVSGVVFWCGLEYETSRKVFWMGSFWMSFLCDFRVFLLQGAFEDGRKGFLVGLLVSRGEENGRGEEYGVNENVRGLGLFVCVCLGDEKIK